MKPNFVSFGAACAALGVVLGAFGAHALRGRVSEPGLVLWETATRYWFVGALGTLGFGLFQSSLPASALGSSSLPGVLLLIGSALFSGSLYALALGAPRALGAITPFGGLCLIAGFLYFAWLSRVGR